MPDFSARITANGALGEWIDAARPPATYSPTDPGEPTRLNPRPGAEHKRLVASVGIQVDISATVGGVEGPLDTALDSRLFFAWPIEWPGAVPVFSHVAGTTSVQSFTPTHAGHYAFGIGRHGGGGAIIFHLDAE